MSGPRWRGWLAAGAIFALGVAVGGGGVAWWGARALRQLLHAPAHAPGLADRTAARIGADLTRDLELTAAESAQVHALLEASATRLKAVRFSAARQAAAELRATSAQIAAALPPEKRDAFHRLSTRRFDRLGLPPSGAPATPEP
jgi:hypothetical protein